MKIVAITLPGDLAAWVRGEAAKADRSMSSWIAEFLEERRRTGSGGVSAADDLLSGPLINAQIEDVFGEALRSASYDSPSLYPNDARFIC